LSTLKEYIGEQTLASLIKLINSKFKKYVKTESLNDRIPAPSAEDNGKFLRVVDGKWSAVELTDVSEVGL
jgi:hypothetical protein